MTSTPHPLALLGLLAALSLAPACDNAAVTSTLPLQCRSDADCRSSLRCELNHCVLPEPNALVLQARVIPRADAGLVPQQVPRLDFDAGSAITIALNAPAPLRGNVRPADDPFTVNVPGELELRADGDIPGLDYRFTARSLAGLDADGYGFATHVLPGRTYRGIFRPTDDTWPRVFFTMAPSDIARGDFTVALPSREAIVRVQGRVRFTDYSPVRNARVVVLAKSGEVLGSTTTDPERGRFSLPIHGQVEAVDVRVEPPRDEPVFPEFRVDDLAIDAELDVVAPALPSGADRFEATLAIVAGSDRGSGQPVAGIPVTIVGVLAGGTLRLSTTTDAEGLARFETFPGAYECLISVPSGMDHASWHGFITLAPGANKTDEEHPVIRLNPRLPVRARVLDFEGEPVNRGAVELERNATRGPDDALVIAPEPFFAEIAADGTIELRVDPGSYRARVSPDPSTGAPITRIDDLTIEAEATDFTWRLRPPSLLHLTIADPEGRWLPEATVELWLPTPEGPPRLLTRGTTNANGFWDVLVPHDLHPSSP